MHSCANAPGHRSRIPGMPETDWLTMGLDRCLTRRVKNTSMCKGSNARRTRAARPLMQAQVLDLRSGGIHLEQVGLFLPAFCK